MKCECGVELFKRDIVHSFTQYANSSVLRNSSGGFDFYIGTEELVTIFRCPKCFKTKKVKI